MLSFFFPECPAEILQVPLASRPISRARSRNGGSVIEMTLSR